MASGKSKVREFLEGEGVVTIDADSIGHAVLQPEGSAFAQVADRWPDAVREGEIHRPSLASIVFNDPDELAALEAITHPHIFDTINAQVEGVASVVVLEVPVLSHGLGDDWRRVVVDCRDEVRRERAVARGMSESDVRSRMARQPSRSAWLAAAELVIPNHGSEEELGQTVTDIVAAGALNPFRAVSPREPRDP
jgi:dephospho-CoA kinase